MQPLSTSVWKFLKKLKIGLSYNLALACDILYTPTYMQWMGKGDYERGEGVWGDWNVIVIQTEKRTIWGEKGQCRGRVRIKRYYRYISDNTVVKPASLYTINE